MSKAAQTQQTPTENPQSQSQGRKWVKVRYYIGASERLYFYMPDGTVERILIDGQRWAEEIINYLKSKGKHYVVGRYGCSRATHVCGIYRNHVYVAKIAPKRLLRMITSSATWRRSEHARRIAEALRSL
jgi:hypothetical protein